MLELLKRFWVVLTAAVLVGLVYGEFWLIQKPENWLFRWMKMYLAIGPNLIADLMAILVGYAIFRFTAREHYVETMKAVRKAVQQLPPELQLRPEQVQGLMAGMVPIVSRLYFGQRRLTSEIADEKKIYETTCLSCGKRCIVEQGHCTEKCSDIPESWAGQKLVEITVPPPESPAKSR